MNGDGPTVGEAISSHPNVDMVSFTGSTRAGILVAKAAADTVKRVTQELGGKSANIILDGADLKKAVPAGVLRCFTNSGQSCQAPARMLIHRSDREAAVALAKRTAEAVKVGAPTDPATTMGPLVNRAQFNKVQGLIARGIEEGATLICGGAGRPADFNRGYFVRPTVFADVTPDMAIAKDEIFGPVLSMMTYDTEDGASESQTIRLTVWPVMSKRVTSIAPVGSQRESVRGGFFFERRAGRPQCSFRRLQEVRQWPRARRLRFRGVSRSESRALVPGRMSLLRRSCRRIEAVRFASARNQFGAPASYAWRIKSV